VERVGLQSDIVVDERMVRRLAWDAFRRLARGPLWLLMLFCVLVAVAAAIVLRDAAGPFVVTAALAVVVLPPTAYFTLRSHFRRSVGGRTIAIGFGESAFALSAAGIRSTIAYAHVVDARRRGKLVVVRYRDGQSSILPIELITDDRLRLLRSGGEPTKTSGGA